MLLVEEDWHGTLVHVAQNGCDDLKQDCVGVWSWFATICLSISAS